MIFCFEKITYTIGSHTYKLAENGWGISSVAQYPNDFNHVTIMSFNFKI